MCVENDLYPMNSQIIKMANGANGIGFAPDKIVCSVAEMAKVDLPRNDHQVTQILNKIEVMKLQSSLFLYCSAIDQKIIQNQIKCPFLPLEWFN